MLGSRSKVGVRCYIFCIRRCTRETEIDRYNRRCPRQAREVRTRFRRSQQSVHDRASQSFQVNVTSTLPVYVCHQTPSFTRLLRHATQTSSSTQPHVTVCSFILPFIHDMIVFYESFGLGTRDRNRIRRTRRTTLALPAMSVRERQDAFLCAILNFISYLHERGTLSTI